MNNNCTAEQCLTLSETKVFLPITVYFLALTIFVMGTSEFMVAGMMPALVTAFDVSSAEIGYLISVYAAGMVLGGPLLTLLFLYFRMPNKIVLVILMSLYALATLLAVLTTSYKIIFIARAITGIASSAAMGAAFAIAANLVSHTMIGRSAGVVITGLMLSTVLGVPIATIMEQHWGWRSAFWCVFGLTIICILVIMRYIPRGGRGQVPHLSDELNAFKSLRLWAAFLTSGLIIGATFAAFSYFTPIFIDVTGFKAAAIPFVLMVYGVANTVGNIIVSRLADRYTLIVLVVGLFLLTVTLGLFALFTHYPTVAVLCFLGIGLVGVPLNPAMITRVMKASTTGALVNTVHTSMINVGLMTGSWVGGYLIASGYGLRAPLWLGMVLALLGLLSLLPKGWR